MASPSETTTVGSPCVSVCNMNAKTGWCEGCCRTIDEIARWSRMSDAEKSAVLMELELRQLELRRSKA